MSDATSSNRASTSSEESIKVIPLTVGAERTLPILSPTGVSGSRVSTQLSFSDDIFAELSEILIVGLASAHSADDDDTSATSLKLAGATTPWDDQLQQWATQLNASTSAGKVTVLPVPANCGATEVLAVGLGAGADSADDAEDDQLRTAAGSVARTLVAKAKSHALSAIFAPAALGVAAATEGLHLGGYEIPRPAGGRTSMSQSVTITLPLADSTASEDSDEANYRHAVISSEAVIAARDLVNCPANLLYPESYAQQLQQLEQLGVTVTVLDEKQLADEGFGGIISVGQGSTRPPRLVKLDWAPESTTRQVAFVGKGITFDTGGISIKPASNMENMISDMGGSAAVVASVAAAAALNIPVHLTGWVALAENMPDGGATRPGDVVTAYDGHTIEVLNTDAEGRMVLCDAIARASEDKPDTIIDMATLTGAQMVALGLRTFGIMGDAAVREPLARLATESGEDGWPMPIPAHLKDDLKTPVADLRNINNVRWGGMLYAAAFLREFVGDDIEWAHLDIAGPAYNTKSAYGYTPARATGVPVRTLISFLEEITEEGVSK